MVLVIVLVGIILGFTGEFMFQKSNRNSCIESIGEKVEPVGWGIAITAGFAAFGLLIASLCLAGADKKIEMYQEENFKIEQQIASVVEEYQEYETGVFKEVKPDSSIELVALYPELKSDTLVQSQIEVYVQNNEEIKILKSMVIDRSVVNWMLYFGS